MMKKIFNNVEEVLSAIVMLFMLMLTFVNVIARYFLHSSISFTVEITTSLFVLLCTLGAAIAVKRNAHLGLSLISEKLGKKWQRRLFIFANILGVTFSVVLLYKVILMVIHEYELKQISITLQWPEWIYGSFIPIGATFIGIRYIQSVFQALRSREG